MRLPCISAVLAVSLTALSPDAWAGMTQLGEFDGYVALGVVNYLGDAPSNYPDKFQPPVGNPPTQASAFREIRFTLGKTQDVRLDLAWMETTDTISSAVGQRAAEVNHVYDFSLRDANNQIVPAAPGPAYFSGTTLVKSNYGAITQLAEVQPPPPYSPVYDTFYRTTERSQAQVYRALPPGSYSVTVYLDNTIGVRPPNAKVGLYTGPAEGFAAYQVAVGRADFGPPAIPPGDPNPSGITPSATGVPVILPPPPPPPPPTQPVCPVTLSMASTRIAGFFSGVMTVGNPEASTQTGWTVNGVFGNSALVYGAKNAKVTQKAGLKSFKATPVTASATLPPGETRVVVTFNAFSGTKDLPVTGLTLTVGGKTCTAVPAP